MRPFEELGLPETATPDEVKTKWHELRSMCHPDKGGTAAQFHRLNTAYKMALAEAGKPKLCEACSGVGKVEVRRGFAAVQLPCESCRGTGVQQ